MHAVQGVTHVPPLLSWNFGTAFLGSAMLGEAGAIVAVQCELVINV